MPSTSTQEAMEACSILPASEQRTRYGKYFADEAALTAHTEDALQRTH